MAIRPDYQQALVDLGSYDLRLGETFAGQPDVAQRWYEKALTALESARALDAKSTARFVEKMRARGNPDDTIPDVGDRILFNNLAIAYVKLGHAGGALDAYFRMRKLQPTNGALYRDIAALQAAVGQTDAAAVALSPGDRDRRRRRRCEATAGGALPELSRGRRPDSHDRAAGRHADPHGAPGRAGASVPRLAGAGGIFAEPTPPPIGGRGAYGSGEPRGELNGSGWFPAFLAGAMALSHSADGRDREGEGVVCSSSTTTSTTPRASRCSSGCSGTRSRPRTTGCRRSRSARRFAPDLVLLDIGLPKLDGYEVAQRLRADATCEEACLVAITGWGRDEDSERANEGGFDHHLTRSRSTPRYWRR